MCHKWHNHTHKIEIPHWIFRSMVVCYDKTQLQEYLIYNTNIGSINGARRHFNQQKHVVGCWLLHRHMLFAILLEHTAIIRISMCTIYYTLVHGSLYTRFKFSSNHYLYWDIIPLIKVKHYCANPWCVACYQFTSCKLLPSSECYYSMHYNFLA